jgi:SH3 domain-containing guanine exchange factor
MRAVFSYAIKIINNTFIFHSCQAIFEVISSEHSYLLSLEILIRMFKDSKELSDTMTKTERHHLFSNITDVCEASKK